MKNRYRKFKRGNVWWCHDGQTGKQTSLKTKSEPDAIRQLDAMNRPYGMAEQNLEMARTFLKFSDADRIKRTRADVFQTKIENTKGATQFRWQRAVKDKAFAPLLTRIVVETTSNELLAVIKSGKVSTNVFMRRLHNYASGMGWLLAPIIPKNYWPKADFKAKRAITLEEHTRITEREPNPERKAYYEVCWLVGGSQTDVAKLRAEDIDWQTRTLTYFRQKNGEMAQMEIGSGLETILRSLPQSGNLFPYLSSVRESDRATEFKQRCNGLNISGVTLHSYRYAWAERAKMAGVPERFAQQALGHSSKAVHRAYARNAVMRVPSLEDYESRMQSKVVPLKQAAA